MFGTSSAPDIVLSLPEDDRRADHTALKRKLANSCALNWRVFSEYPSPPMSGPPSPNPEKHFTSSSSRQIPPLTPSTTEGSAATPVTGSAIATPALESSALPTILPGLITNLLPDTQYPPTNYAPLNFIPASASRPESSFGGIAPTTAAAAGTSAFPASIPLQGTSVAGKSARKSKAHVASACVNCKRAHLSCDIQRPCERCVSSGKQDSCYDVQHKKRGRPRLRDEGDARTEQADVASSSQSQSATTVQQPPPRIMASTRPRRAESFRSHQSHGSESSSYGQITPASANLPTFLPSQPSVASVNLIGAEVPTAYLDLDLVIVRANRAFQQFAAGHRSLVGTQLADIAASADGHNLVDIRNRLRGERERRDPTYLPPIFLAGQNPLAGIQDSDVDRLTQGFTDNTYYWMMLPAGPGAPAVAARVRLAKGSTYFVVVTFPNVRPITHSPTSMIASPYPYAPSSSSLPFASPESQPNRRQSFTQSAPPQHHAFPFETPPPPGIAPSMRSFVPSQPSFHPQPSFATYPPAHPPPSIGRPVTSYPFAVPSQDMPRPHTQQPMLHITTDPGVFLPPIMESQTRQAPVTPREAAPGPSDSSEGSEGQQSRTPKKRRRMGIDEVLQ